METELNRRPASGEPYRYAELPWKRLPDWLAEFRSESDTAARRGDGAAWLAETRAYSYEAAPGAASEPWDQAGNRPSASGSEAEVPGRPVAEPEDAPALEARLQQLHAEEIAAAELRGRGEGWETGVAHGRALEARALAAERDRLAAQALALTRSFAESRATYLHRLEEETAQLALAIAARILRREARSDPLGLIGAVRAALGELASSTQVRLRVPAQDATEWRDALGRLPALSPRLEVVGEVQMEPGECRLETELGLADLGLWAQWKTIERGFFARADDGDEAGESRDEVSPRDGSHAV